MTASGAYIPASIIDPFLISSSQTIAGGLYVSSALGGGQVQLSLSANTLSVRVYENIQAVPEPSTWAMMLMGFAGVGFMTYFRRCRDIPGVFV
jgi:hypothetical protein